MEMSDSEREHLVGQKAVDKAFHSDGLESDFASDLVMKG
jgi:hypothetical protein